MKRALVLFPVLLLAATLSIRAEDKPAPAPAPLCLTYKAGDKTTLEGMFYAPLNPGAPGILCIHALGRDPSVWEPLARRLQADGYAVFAMALRGHPELNRTGQRKSPWVGFEIGQFKAMAPDVDAALACLASQREVDGKRLGVVGEEFGANVALAGGGREAVRTAVLLTARLDARGIAGPASLATFGERPCLAIASADDEQGAAALEALKGAAKGRFEPVLVETDKSATDFGAAMLSDADKKGLMDRVAAWLKETLPPSAP